MANNLLHNEPEILVKIAGGDQLAFNLLFKHYHIYVHSFSRKITHSDNLAVEIVQDIFLKIWLGREKLGHIDSFGAYLNRLVRNHCFNVLRQLAQETKSSAIHLKFATDVDHSTVQQLDYKETESILNEAIEMLSPQQRMVYMLCHQQGHKYEEAAEKMNISHQTVHAYMKDALRKIREHFKKHSVEYSLFITVLFK
ncbi:RNA polymerase sigma factor [Pedobacter sp. Hv1]|uniref:RNA polymerase sigma factor n=1 Tax=Pedobacter sp. Hv1 TaxID=1740090 RepID=UPI0006D8CDE1|nr:RNA polymerase sigma-70 factor [Pedobacter sp. Hv1]KQC02049.1 RNA polymerase subunit sigma-70 [Pedobacter sp. Hv1]